MLIRRMTAVFGKLQGQTLELGNGLNIIQSPNEAGKSTWCAFLLSMLYGVNSRERERAGYVPDKVRYAPWSGAPMSGRLDCRVEERDLTLLRSTRRPASPMGEFRAVYAGTSEPVSGLTGQVCGEALLGVTREVYERSAFIRQAGLPVSQDAELERRISSLVSSGEEDVSCSEASAALRKQLNRRRHNKTGQIPALEEELQETECRLAQLEELGGRLAEATARADALAVQESGLSRQLRQWERWESAQRRQALRQARAEARDAQEQAQALRQKLEEDWLPEPDAIARLRGGIANLEMSRRTLAQAQAQRDQAQAAYLQAESAAGAHPFGGMPPSQAEALPLDLPPKPQVPIWSRLLALAIGLCLCAALCLARQNQLLAAGCGAGACGLCLLISCFLTAQKQKRWKALAAERRQTRDRELEAYAALYQDAESAREDSAAKSAAYESLKNTMAAAEGGILSEVRRFAPSVRSLSEADGVLRACVFRRREVSAAEAKSREAQLRWTLLSTQSQEQGGAFPDSENPKEEPDAALLSPPPGQSREDLSAALEQVRENLAAARSEADLLTGQCQALGDPAVLRSDAAHTREEIARLEREYDAIQLALDTLEESNAVLQTRFSPSLGLRAGEIFRELTEGRYSGVALDRSLSLSAETAEEALYRSAALLSAGTADQLYLSVRLAICQLALPAEDPAPIVLDDALANFDDQRCAVALNWLLYEAERRQILLFTCHSREADLLAGKPEVRVQRLTDAS